MRLAMLLLVIAASTFTSSPVVAQQSATDEVLAIENERVATLLGGDADAYANYLGEEFFYNVASGGAYSKKEYVELLRSGAVKVKSVRREPSGVEIYGNVAVVTYVSHSDVNIRGEDRELHLRTLHVWVKRDGQWKLVARQATNVPQK